jgi:predicted anti-sigma-YlaC factor YlaD
VSLTGVDRRGRSVYQYHELFHPRRKNPLRLPLLATALLGLALAGCRSIAVGAMADAVSGSGGVYGKDRDPELVKAAIPFGLKTMEGLLEEKPEHVGLLTALASGFTQYGYAFVQADADDAELQGRNAEARAGRERARALYLRARDYGLRGLDVGRPGLSARLRGVKDVEAALAAATREDVPLLYWTAAAWGAAIAAGKDRMDLVAELPVPVAMMRRALALDETFDDGAIHEFFLTYEASRSEAQGGGPAVARKHFERAVAISGGKKLAPLVNFAESVLVQRQDRAEFTRLLREVVQADPGAEPRLTLSNVLAQRRARLLLAHVEDLFAWRTRLSPRDPT